MLWSGLVVGGYSLDLKRVGRSTVFVIRLSFAERPEKSPVKTRSLSTNSTDLKSRLQINDNCIISTTRVKTRAYLDGRNIGRN